MERATLEELTHIRGIGVTVAQRVRTFFDNSDNLSVIRLMLESGFNLPDENQVKTR